MTLSIAFLFIVLGAMVTLFMTEKLPVDLTAFLGLVILVFAGFVDPQDAFVGFSSPAVITMLSIFIVSGALLETGVADSIGGRIHRWVGGKEIPLIITLMLVAGVMSAFMNNIAATAVLMPAVASLGAKAGIAPGRLFMPLSFGAILGGTTTLVGTPPNLLAGDILEKRGYEPFTLFEFAPFGLALLGLGTLYMCTVGRRLLPQGEASSAPDNGIDLRQFYGIERRLFRLRIPPGSKLDGATVGDTRVGNELGVQIVSILRGDKRVITPRGETRLEGNDELLVQGQRDSLKELLKVRELEVGDVPSGQIELPAKGVVAVRFAIRENSSVRGKTLSECGFRERFSVVVVEIERAGSALSAHLAAQVLETGDVVTGVCVEAGLEALELEFDVQTVGDEALEHLSTLSMFVLDLPSNSAMIGSSLGESRMGELTGLSVIGLVRDAAGWVPVTPDAVLEPHDRLLVAGDRSRISGLLAVGDVELQEGSSTKGLEGDQNMVEATVAPRSVLEGKTAIESGFRDRYGMQILSVWRAGEHLYDDLGNLPLAVGDALLLLGDAEASSKLASDRDLILLSVSGDRARRTKKAPYAIGALLLMVGLVMTGLQPIQFAAFTAASLAILSGALSMREAYRVIEWKAIFLVAAVLPAGAAMESSGAAAFLAGSVTDLAGPLGPYAVLAALVALSSLLSQGLDGAPAVVLLSPVVLETAIKLDLSPYPLMMGVALAASAAFMTPFSHKANLLVMGIGGYRSKDFLRVGTPLTIILLALVVVMVPMLIPF